eukprot:6367408-Prymnesium_polylepis.1
MVGVVMEVDMMAVEATAEAVTAEVTVVVTVVEKAAATPSSRTPMPGIGSCTRARATSHSSSACVRNLCRATGSAHRCPSWCSRHQAETGSPRYSAARRSIPRY